MRTLVLTLIPLLLLLGLVAGQPLQDAQSEVDKEDTAYDDGLGAVFFMEDVTDPTTEEEEDTNLTEPTIMENNNELNSECDEIAIEPTAAGGEESENLSDIGTPPGRDSAADDGATTVPATTNLELVEDVLEDGNEGVTGQEVDNAAEAILDEPEVTDIPTEDVALTEDGMAEVVEKVAENMMGEAEGGEEPNIMQSVEDMFLTEVDPHSDNIYNQVDIDSEEIVDVIRNFIAEQDPILELFLTVCFVHPRCFQFEVPTPTSELGAEGREMLILLKERRPETARMKILSKIENVRRVIKDKMFQTFSEEVAARGVSVAATKNIIDSVKDVWSGVNTDLSSLVSSIQEIFSMGIPEINQEELEEEGEMAENEYEEEEEEDRGVKRSRNASIYVGISQIADILNRIPQHVGEMFRQAAQQGFSRYRQHSSWDSWKLESK